ncbi:MAG TPA: hypothetical protein DHM44_01700 [Flexistipes sinusarabici]|uniref:Peptidase S8/S53 domain-containing protein n=1 Tax=Flexistipes sinusarabici TaxID=2352 RepID=A0A3D5Q936_FLESI|nr:hypothetical protein [Flexistipes sinusarabici]
MRWFFCCLFFFICLQTYADTSLFKYLGKNHPQYKVPAAVKIIKIGNVFYLSGDKDLIYSIFDNSSIKEINPPKRKLKFFPNDDFFENQWGLHNPGDTDINWPEAIDILLPVNKSPIVVVMDSGIAWNHPDLQSNLLTGGDFGSYGYNFCPYDNLTDTYDYAGHGTHIAGIIGAVTNNLFGIAGIGDNNIKLLNMKITCGNSFDINFTAELSAISKILELKEAGYNIRFVNMSFGGSEYIKEEEAALKTLTDNEIYLFSAAGNEGESKREFPAGYENVISVGSLNRENEISSFSNYGEWVDIYAPGSDIIATFNEYLAKPESLYLLSNYKDAFRNEFNEEQQNTTLNKWRLDSSGHATITLNTTSSCSDNVSNSIIMGPFNPDLPEYRNKNLIVKLKSPYYNSQIYLDWSMGNNQKWLSVIKQSGYTNMGFIYRYAKWPVSIEKYDRVKLRICFEGIAGMSASIDAVRVSASDTPDAFLYDYGTSMATPFVTASAALSYLQMDSFSKSDLLNNSDTIPSLYGNIKKLNLSKFLSFTLNDNTSEDKTPDGNNSGTDITEDNITDNKTNIEPVNGNENNGEGSGGGGGCSIAGTANNNLSFLIILAFAFFVYRFTIKNTASKNNE